MTKDVRDIVFAEYGVCRTDEERILFFLRFAILAPSTHNSQPWRFSVSGNSCAVFRDSDLAIPLADPEGRDMHISIGCAIENLVLAAHSYGASTTVAFGPFDNDKVAEIRFDFGRGDGTAIDEETLRAICIRINARGLFKQESVEHGFLQRMKEGVYPSYAENGIEVQFLDHKKEIEGMAGLTAEGLTQAYKSDEFRREMSGWMNHNLSKKKQGIPGWALKMPFLLSFILPAVIRRVNIGSKLAYLNRISISSAPLVAIFTSPRNDPETWLKVGRIAERTMVECYKNGYQTSIFVASIEMGDMYRKVQRLIGTSSRPHFVLVIGKIDSLHKPTLRMPLHAKMKT